MENIKQLQKLAEVFDTDKIITSDEIEQVLKGILVIMNSFKKDNQTLNKETKEVVEILLDRVLTENAKLKELVNRETSDQKEDFAKQVKELKDLVFKIQTIKPIDGITPKKGEDYFTDDDKTEIVEDVLAKVKLPEYEVYSLEEKGEEIVAEINALPTDKEEYKIDAKHIKNLPESKIVGGGTKFLQYLADVNISTPTDGQVLTYDDTTRTWKNEASAGGGGAWGTITGTLSNQTDLQTALDAKANSSGALTQFIGNGNWKVWYSDGSGDVKELALGADGTFLKSNGAAVAPTFATPAGSGDVSKVGTPVNNQVGVWTGDGTLEGDTALTFDTATDTLTSGIFNSTSLTASEIVITDGSKNLVSAAVATYPSLTELTYVKGVTSAIQTQLNAKGVGDMVLASVQSVTGLKTFDTTKLAVKGSSTGTTAIASANAGASDYTATLQAATGTIAYTSDIPSLSGYVNTTGTPANNQLAIFTDADTLEGDASLTYDGTSLNLATAKNFQIAGATILADAAGTTTLSNIDALDATTESTIESAIDTLANLTSVQGRTITLVDAGANAVFGWDDVAGAYENLTAGEVRGAIGLATTDSPMFTAIELGHASDTTITRTGAGAIAVEGVGVALNSISLPHTASQIELGHASDTTISRVSAGVIAVEGVNVLTTATGLPLSGGTMTGNITLGENTSIALDPAGSADGKYSGITVTGTGGTTIAFGDLIYLSSTDSRWELADADSATTADRMLGMAVTSSTDGGALTVLLQGIIRADAKFPALTIGSPVYLGETAGAVQTAIPTGADNVIRRVGYAMTADELYFNPSMDSQITVA